MRGVGGPKKSEGLPLEALAWLPDGREPWCPGGPLWPKRTMILGTWWLTREIELANAKVSHIVCSWKWQAEAVAWHRVASWWLPASKTDQAGVGVERIHGCACTGNGVMGGWPCPVCCGALHTEEVQRQFPHRSPGGLPLCPTAQGTAVLKSDMVKTIQKAAELLGRPLCWGDGTQKFTGHALRVGGAQSLARAGLDTWCIALLARHTSSAIFGYVRDAPLGGSDQFAQRATQARALTQERHQMRQLLTRAAASEQEAIQLKPMIEAILRQNALADKQQKMREADLKHMTAALDLKLESAEEK